MDGISRLAAGVEGPEDVKRGRTRPERVKILGMPEPIEDRGSARIVGPEDEHASETLRRDDRRYELSHAFRFAREAFEPICLFGCRIDEDFAGAGDNLIER